MPAKAKAKQAKVEAKKAADLPPSTSKDKKNTSLPKVDPKKPAPKVTPAKAKVSSPPKSKSKAAKKVATPAKTPSPAKPPSPVKDLKRKGTASVDKKAPTSGVKKTKSE